MTTSNPSEMDQRIKRQAQRLGVTSEGLRSFLYDILGEIEKAHSEGYRAGIEAAAKVAEECETGASDTSMETREAILRAIRRLAEEDGA